MSPTVPDKCSPVEIVEEGEDKKGQLAPGLLQAELECITIHHGCWVVEQLLSVRWGMEVPTTGSKDQTTGSWPVPDPQGKGKGREAGKDDGRKWGRRWYGKRWHDELRGHCHATGVGEIAVEYGWGSWPFTEPLPSAAMARTSSYGCHRLNRLKQGAYHFISFQKQKNTRAKCKELIELWYAN